MLTFIKTVFKGEEDIAGNFINSKDTLISRFELAKL